MGKHTTTKRSLCRVICLMFGLALLLQTPIALGATTHGYVTMDNVLLRKKPQKNADHIDRLNTHWAAEVLGAVGGDGYTWYHVKTNIPSNPGRDYTGYLREDVFRMMTTEEEDAWKKNPDQATWYAGVGSSSTPLPGESLGSYAKVTVDGANLRKTASDTAPAITALMTNTVVSITGPAKDGFYPVLYQGNTGFMNVSHLRMMTDAEISAHLGSLATPAPSTSGGYVKLTKGGVNLRETPGGRSQKQLPQNTILPYTGAPVYMGGYQWVSVIDKEGTPGYVRSDCYVHCDAGGNELPPAAVPTFAPSAPTSVPVPGGSDGTLTLIKGGVNLRKTPGGSVIGRLNRGTVLPYYGFAQQGGYTWYYVTSTLGSGYIRSDMTKLSGGAPAPVPTSAPGITNTGSYIITTKSRVNLRKTPAGLTLVQVDKGKVYPIIGPTPMRDGYTWFFVRTEQNTGYLRSDCVRQLTQIEVTDYLSGKIPSLTPPTGGSPVHSAHLITTIDKLNIRNGPSLDAKVLAQVNQGNVYPYRSSLSTGGKIWHQISFGGATAYVLGDFSRLMTDEEYRNWAAGHATPPPIATPAPSELSDQAVTVMDRVLVRKAGSMNASTLTLVYKMGTRVQLRGAAAKDGYYSWYPVRASGVDGFIRSDMLRVLTLAEVGASSTTPPLKPGEKPEASYRNLRRGMHGEDVLRLQNELVRLGLLESTYVNGTYTSATEQAVREYQKAADLFVDGVAGQKTQDALYGTVPPGTNSGSTSTVDTTIYPVEKSDWYTGDIQRVWTKGKVAVITDVRTGISFRAKRWSGAYHSDAEPLTAADTAAMCKIYGVKRAQEISDKNLYQRRPLWVTLDGRTFAASLYGVPHNYPAGDTIPDNDYNGQFCVHFVNSRTHSSGRVDRGHMDAIQYAYDHAPSRK